DEADADAAVVRPQRAAREQEVGELPTAVGETGEVAAGRAVLERQLHLLDRDAGSRRVDRHPRLRAEARREREDGGAGAGRERALTRERLGRVDAGAEPDERPRGPLRDPEASAPPLGEARD